MKKRTHGVTGAMVLGHILSMSFPTSRNDNLLRTYVVIHAYWRRHAA
jgi:hypothetical protein